MSENLERKYSRRNRSIFFPLLIIFIGVVLLLSNFGIIPDGWVLLLRFWPIFFIFGGLDDLVNRKWTGAVINVGLGTILILANFGFFSMSTWQIILNFWPVLIIALGLEVIFKGRSAIGSIIGVAFSTLLILGIIWFALQGPLTKEAVSTPISYEVNDVEAVELNMKSLVANMNLETSEIPNKLIEGKISTSENENLEVSSSFVEANSVQRIQISTDGNVIFPSRNMNVGFPWDLKLSSEIPFTLKIEQVFGLQKFYLRDLMLESIDTQLVMGTVEVQLPDAIENGGKLECVIGEMTIIVPEDMALEIQLDTGITGVNLGEGFIREGDSIYSKAAKRDGKDQLLVVNLPIGSLVVKNP
jgi:hypothetical protein